VTINSILYWDIFYEDERIIDGGTFFGVGYSCAFGQYKRRLQFGSEHCKNDNFGLWKFIGFWIDGWL
jgi:hypothetical protein